MITKFMWEDFNEKISYKNSYGIYSYSNSEATWLLLMTIVLTLITIISDIIFMPIEIIYYLCLKKVIMKRKKGE